MSLHHCSSSVLSAALPPALFLHVRSHNHSARTCVCEWQLYVQQEAVLNHIFPLMFNAVFWILRWSSWGHQHSCEYRCTDSVQRKDIQPVAGAAPEHRVKDSGWRVQSRYRLLGESAAASQGLHGQSKVRWESLLCFSCYNNLKDWFECMKSIKFYTSNLHGWLMIYLDRQWIRVCKTDLMSQVERATPGCAASEAVQAETGTGSGKWAFVPHHQRGAKEWRRWVSYPNNHTHPETVGRGGSVTDCTFSVAVTWGSNFTSLFVNLTYVFLLGMCIIYAKIRKIFAMHQLVI